MLFRNCGSTLADINYVDNIIIKSDYNGEDKFMNAKATCEVHGYKNVSIDILPGVGHEVHFEAELNYFYAHYLLTHPAN